MMIYLHCFRSSVVSLFDARLHVTLMQVDYTSLLSTDHALSHKVTTLTPIHQCIWFTVYGLSSRSLTLV